MQKGVQALLQQSTLSNSPSSSYRFFLAFGSNLGDRESNLKIALNYIGTYAEVLRLSQWQKTTPLKNSLYNTSNHDYYLNFVAEVITQFNPFDFYNLIIVPIENKLGHCRESKWMPRALDIDVVFAAKNDKPSFAECTPVEVRQGSFFVPHCEYFNRAFWQTMIEVDLNYVPKR